MNSISKSQGLRPNGEMSMIGYAIAAILFVGLLPLLPVFVVYYVVDKITGGGRESDY
ncbi:DUF7535 family protein [Halosimplex salinum]|uniref:DUF7535 family protein n=1 Tax=Halosimplex salinum TaxID=1710538 RepID=UPI0013DD8865|nr:hypothetical protein [Halosimplex salinum]